MSSTPMDYKHASELLAEQMMIEPSERGLGDAQLRSNLATSTQYLALSEGATNLLTKACRDLAAGRPERAASLVDRALRLPRPERDEPRIGAYEAHIILFSRVCDAVEDSEKHDYAWLDAAEAALPRCGDRARQGLLRTLWAIDQDYRLEPAESRRIHALVPHNSDGADLPNTVEDLDDADEATARAAVIELLQATIIYEAELHQRRPPGRRRAGRCAPSRRYPTCSTGSGGRTRPGAGPPGTAAWG
jgi:hypothetical protein